MRIVHAALGVILCFAALVKAQNCALQVPNNPLTAAGLATPYLLMNIPGDPNSGACDEAVTGTGTFVQGVVIDLNSGAISVYNPLVINVGTTPAIVPTAPVLPVQNVVGLWFGFNGGKLVLQNAAGGNGLATGNCVNGFGGTVFGEYAHCNGIQWLAAANNAILNGSLVVPPLGTAKDGKPCVTVRDFAVVDQDQSDNVLTQYLMTATNQFAQDTPANRAQLGTNNFVANASDNRLVNLLIDQALGCTPWTVPDLADATGVQKAGALPLNELFAAAWQAPPVALVPANDPMAKMDGAPSVDKINAYRMSVNQPTIADANMEANGLLYCQQFVAAAFTRIQANAAALQTIGSPDGMGTLYFFLVNTRFPVSVGPAANGGLDCVNMGVANPFTNGGILPNTGPLPAGGIFGMTNTTLVIILAGTGGALVLIGAGAAIFIFVSRRNAATTAANNFMAL